MDILLSTVVILLCLLPSEVSKALSTYLPTVDMFYLVEDNAGSQPNPIRLR